MILAIGGLIFAIWIIASLIELIIYNNAIIATIGTILYFVGAAIVIAVFSIKKIIEEIGDTIWWHRQKNHNKEYAKYKEEVLDSKYCYMSFDEWKEKQNVKR